MQTCGKYELSTDVLGEWTIGRSAKDLVHPNTGMPVGGKGLCRYRLGPAVCLSSLSLSVLLTSSLAGLPLLLQLKRVVCLSVSSTISTARMRLLLTIEVFGVSIAPSCHQHH